MIDQAFDQRIIEEVHADEIQIDRIGNRRYSSMMAAHELGNLGGALGLRVSLGIFKRS